MVAVISRAFAAVLERNRDRLNTRWFLSRSRGDPADFLRVLTHNLDGAISAIEAAGCSPETVDRVCDALYAAALEHWSRGRLGTDPCTGAMAALFQRAFPQLLRVLADRPEEAVRALTHALVVLGREGCVCPSEWVGDIAAVGSVAADLDALRSIGLVMAWRRGLTHARVPALSALHHLPTPVVTAIADRMGLAERTSDRVVARLSRRWRATRESDAGPPRLAVVGFAGAFEAFGGPFARPPSLVVADGNIYAGDATGSWVVHADDFGAVLRPVSELPHRAGGGNAQIRADGTVTWRGLVAVLPVLARAAAWAETEDTLAVACADSHRLRLIAVQGATA